MTCATVSVAFCLADVHSKTQKPDPGSCLLSLAKAGFTDSAPLLAANRLALACPKRKRAGGQLKRRQHP